MKYDFFFFVFVVVVVFSSVFFVILLACSRTESERHIEEEMLEKQQANWGGFGMEFTSPEIDEKFKIIHDDDEETNSQRENV